MGKKICHLCKQQPSLLVMEKPRMDWFCLIILINGSRVRININGDNGHSCLVPYLIGTVSERALLILTFAEGLSYRVEIHKSMC